MISINDHEAFIIKTILNLTVDQQPVLESC